MKHHLQHSGTGSGPDTKPFISSRWRQPNGAGEGPPPDTGSFFRHKKASAGTGKSASGGFRKFAFSCLLLAAAGLHQVSAQTAPQWDRTLGGSDLEELKALQQTSDGGYIAGGHSASGISGDKTQAWQGWRDLWVVKLNADGTKAWDKTLGLQLDEQLGALQQTSDGGYILGGYTTSGKDDEGDFLVIKLDAAGNMVWSNTFGNYALDYLTALQQTSDGGYILGGRSYTNFADIYDWDGKSDPDYWVIKLDAAGNKVWDKNFGGTGSDELSALQQTSDGGYILGGSSGSGINSHKTQSNRGGHDYWVVKIDANGTKVWDRTFGGDLHDNLRALRQTPDGGYILGGTSGSGFTGDKSQASKGSNDYWVLKLDASGNKVWDKAIGGSGSENLAALQITADGDYLLGGTSGSGIDGDKTEASKGSADYWVVQLDAAGSKQWDKTVGGGSNDLLQALHLTSDGGYVLGGNSVSGISGHKTQAHLGGGDYWIVKQQSQNPAAVHRLNAGGGQVSASLGTFGADNYFSPAPGFTYAATSPIAGTSDDGLYQTERTSTADNGTFAYHLPVANGKYSVVLHFAELYWNSPGQRVFDVSLENALALDNYDIIQKTGAKNTATTESFLVTVTDGLLDIDFSAGAEEGGVNRPKVSAIEVIPYSGNYAFPLANAGADKIVALPDSNLILEGRGTETHGRVDRFTWTQVSGPNAARFYRYSSAPSVFGLVPGTYVFSLSIMDDERAVSAPDQMTVTVLPDPDAPAVSPVHLIHAGGGPVTAQQGIFAADNYFTNGPGGEYNPTTYSTVNPIAGTSDDALYQTERTSEEDHGSFAYRLPVSNGQYTVVLHFAEIYWNSAGQRVFDVKAEGNLALDNYDIVQKAGASFTATTESFVVEVADGNLELLFSAGAEEGGVNRPKISAIEVIPYQSAAQARLAQAASSKPAPATAELSVSAYPNPFGQQINLHLAGAPAGDYSVRVLDLTGRKLYQTNFTAEAGSRTAHAIPMADRSLSSGSLYLVVVEQAGGSFWKVIKMMKE